MHVLYFLFSIQFNERKKTSKERYLHFHIIIEVVTLFLLLLLDDGVLVALFIRENSNICSSVFASSVATIYLCLFCL